MEYNRNHGYYPRYCSKPELEIGTRLEVVVTGKSWDNYVIRSCQSGADYFGMIYLGRWVQEPQPAYSNSGGESQQQEVANSMPTLSSYGNHPNSSTRKFVRQNNLVEAQQQQRFTELTNGREKHTIQHGAPQLQAVPTASSASLSFLKKNKRKAYVPREVPSFSAVGASSSFPMDQRVVSEKATNYSNTDAMRIVNGGQEIGDNDDFTRTLMRYVLKNEKKSNGVADSISNSPHSRFDDHLRLEQAKTLFATQRRAYSKENILGFPSSELCSNLSNNFANRRNGSTHPPFFTDEKSVLPPNGLTVPHFEDFQPNHETVAVGTANFVNVTPLNIAATNQSDSVTEKTSSTVSSNVALVAPDATSVSVSNSDHVSSPQFSSSASALDSGADFVLTSASAASNGVTESTPPPNVCSSPDVADASVYIAASPVQKLVTEQSDGSNKGVANVQSGAEQLATLLGCKTLAAEARKAAVLAGGTTSNNVENQSVAQNEVEPPPLLESMKETEERVLENESFNEVRKGVPEETRKSSSNDNRKIVVKISLGNYPHSTMETKPSPATSTSSTSTRRSVADLRCPPEIAKSFEEQQLKRRSDTGYPPMMPRVEKSCSEMDEDADAVEKDQKKRKTNAKKKKAEAPVENEACAEKPSCNVVGTALDKQTVEENPFSLLVGDIVWAKNGSEPYWPGELFQFTRVNGVAGAVITWFGVDTFTPFVPLSKIEPFPLKYSQRFNPKRNDRKYQKGVARAIYQCRPRSGYYESNMTKYIHEILVNSYHFVLEPFENTKKRKRKSAGFGLKKRKLATAANSSQFDSHSNGPGMLREDEDHFDDDESVSVDDSSGIPEADMDTEQADTSSEQRLSEPSSSAVSPRKSEDSGRTSPRSPIL